MTLRSFDFDYMLKIAIKKAGSVAALSRAIGTSRSSIHYWQSGKSKPQADTLLKLIQYIDK